MRLHHTIINVRFRISSRNNGGGTVSNTPNADTSGRLIVKQALRSRFGVLFVTLVAMLVAPNLVPYTPGLGLILTLLTTAILLSGFVAVATDRVHLFIGLALVIPALALGWYEQATGSTTANILGVFVTMVFFIYLAWMVLLYVLAARKVDANILFAAICVYMLIGYFCGLGYYMIESLIGDPTTLSAFAGNLGIGHPRSEALYYSFVTLTTLGYGDITPITGPSRSLAMIEALGGQVFLVTLMARLVSLHVTQTSRSQMST